MGLFGNITKAISNSQLGKVVGKAVKNIRRVATDIVTGIGGKGGIISKAYSKVQSIGSMALGMILPSADKATIESLQSVTSSSQKAGGVGFVSAFSGSLISARNKVAGTATGITNWFKEGFSYVSGKVSDAAGSMYDSTLEFLGLKDPTTVKDPGTFIADKAKKNVTSSISTSKSGFSVSDGIYNKGNNLGVTDLVGKPSIPLSLQNQPLNLQFDSALKAGVDPSIVDTTRKMGISPFVDEIPALNAPGKMVVPQTKSSSSFLDKIKDSVPDIAEGLLGSLGGFGSVDPAGFASRGTTPSLIGANRLGVGGQGSAGGDFLSNAQRAAISNQQSLLERLG